MRSTRRHRKAVSLAKLTRPRLHAAYPRKRLFRKLDAHRQTPVLWIAGPPGSGKTTLAATWLEARNLSGIWYQLDSGDSDPATFFYYLRQAAEAAGAEGAAPLPLLTSEYLGDVPGFARRWFRELFSRLPAGAVLVLDNFQEVSADSGLHRALASACREIPQGAQLLVMSWVEAPAELSALLADERLARLDPEDLRLSLDEAHGIAAARDALTSAQIRELHAQCAGWAAGFTLLRNRARRTGLVSRIDQRGSMQEVFDYFMTQAFRDVPARARETLFQTAFLSRFTDAMAIEVSGDPGAGELLERLYRRHLFVDRRYAEEVTYEYHALFRTFLLEEARRHFNPHALEEITRRAAATLEGAGLAEDAVQLLVEGGNHEGATRLLEKLAPGFVAAGRGAALEGWIAKLPDGERDRRPWLSYWLGAGITGTKLDAARSAFERAHAGFVRDADSVGEAMAVVGVLHTHHLGLSSLDVIQPWVGILDSVLREDLAFPSPNVAAGIYGTLVGFMLWYAPGHPLYPVCVERLDALLVSGALDLDVKVTAAGHLIEHYAFAGFVRRAARIAGDVEPLLGRPPVSPLARASWRLRCARLDYRRGELGCVRRNLEEALAICFENGFHSLLKMIHGVEADVALSQHDLTPVPAIVEKMRAAFPEGRQQARVHWVLARLAALRGNLEQAQRECEIACSIIGEHGLVLGRLLFNVELASVLLERGEVDHARAVIAPCTDLYPPELLPLAAFMPRAISALLDAVSGDGGDWRARLRADLRRLRDLGVEMVLPLHPLLASQLAQLALMEGIETSYVRAWIRKTGVRPTSPDVPGWPWPVRVRVLGALGIELDDAPLTFRGKLPRKPLELLQAIVAFGGQAVPSETLSNALWPDSEADAADAALRMAVSRLRKLLGHADAVLQQEGKLSLNHQVCWLDVWSLERLFGEIAVGPRPTQGARLLELYQGALLEREREQPWMLVLREKLRRRFVAAVRRVAEAMRSEGQHDGAIALCRKALDQDPGADTEALHREIARSVEAKSRGLLEA